MKTLLILLGLFCVAIGSSVVNSYSKDSDYYDDDENYADYYDEYDDFDSWYGDLTKWLHNSDREVQWEDDDVMDSGRTKRAVGRPNRGGARQRDDRGNNWMAKICSSDAEIRFPKKMRGLTEEEKQAMIEQKTRMHEEFKECCSKPEAEKEACFTTVRQNKFTKICNGDEPFLVGKFVDDDDVEAIKAECCNPEETDAIVQCFTREIRSQKKEGKQERKQVRQQRKQQRMTGGRRTSAKECCVMGKMFAREQTGELTEEICQTGSNNFQVPATVSSADQCKRLYSQCCMRSAGLNERRPGKHRRPNQRG